MLSAQGTASMANISKEHLNKLEYLKKCVTSSYEYWKPNSERYNQFMNFVFNTSLTTNEIGKLNSLSKPTIEFNVLEAFVSRLRGEFAEHEPDMAVSAAEGVLNEDISEELVKTIEVVEAHIRDIFSNASNDGLEYKFYTDCLSGGYSVAKVYTDYLNELSFEQKIVVERIFDPTMSGFDPLARESHKGDGEYCFELIPKTREELADEFGEEAVRNISFTRAIEGFSWSYQNAQQKIALVCDFYKKVKRREKIVKLTNGQTILKKHYEQLAEAWVETGVFEVLPEIISERWTVIEKIDRYVFCENQVLLYEKTPFKYLPLVFIDGNSVNLPQDTGNASRQMTRPYVYQAMGTQKIKNFAGQTIGAEINNMVQHKFKAALESIPEQYLESYTDVQNASTLIYYAFDPNNPERALPAPMEIQRTPTPPIVQEMFINADRVIQSILGSYDAQLGITDGDISGRAIEQGAIHSNAASKPYLVGYINGLNRIATIIIDLIPKFYVTPRSIPVRKANGLRDYQVINKPDNPKSISMKYDPKSLQVKIEVGANGSLEKQRALQQITSLMQASEQFAKFINSMGLETILDNMTIRGIEALKLKAIQFMKQEQAMAQEMADKPTPEQELIQAEKEIELARIAQRQEEAEGNLAIKAAQVANDKEKTNIEFMRLLAEIEDSDLERAIEVERLDSEMTQEAIKFAVDVGREHAKASLSKD